MSTLFRSGFACIVDYLQDDPFVPIFVKISERCNFASHLAASQSERSIRYQHHCGNDVRQATSPSSSLNMHRSIACVLRLRLPASFVSLPLLEYLLHVKNIKSAPSGQFQGFVKCFPIKHGLIL